MRTLCSFRTSNEDYWFHTSDKNLLNDIPQEGFIAPGYKVLIEGTAYTISDMVIEIFASTMTRRLNEFQYGEVSPCDAQLLITIDPEA